VQALEAWFTGLGYDTHRHDTYAIGLTDVGVQAFDYRGAARVALPGQVVVLHPDETHDGRAGTPEGFGYRIVYVAPARIHAAVRAIRGRPCALPFVRESVAVEPRARRRHRGRLSRGPGAAGGGRAGLPPRRGPPRRRPLQRGSAAPDPAGRPARSPGPGSSSTPKRRA
jgi:hypothetical protein